MDKIDIIKDSKGEDWYFRPDTKLAYTSLEDALAKKNGIPRTDIT